MSRTRQWSAALAGLAVSLVPALAHAHPGHIGDGSLLAGLEHPLTGADHVLAMVAVGLWAGTAGGAARWAAPLTFVVAMLAGASLGITPIALVEPAIIASVIVLGLALALALRPSLPVALAAIALFGAAHGAAHGTEGPAAGFVAFSVGFVTATVVLHAAGLILGQAFSGRGAVAVRLFGGIAALVGAGLALGM